MSKKTLFCGNVKLHVNNVCVVDNPESGKHILMNVGGQEGFKFYEQRTEVVYALRDLVSNTPLPEEFYGFYNQRVKLIIKEIDGFTRIVVKNTGPTISGLFIAAYFGKKEECEKKVAMVYEKYFGSYGVKVYRPLTLETIFYGL